MNANFFVTVATTSDKANERRSVFGDDFSKKSR